MQVHHYGQNEHLIDKTAVMLSLEHLKWAGIRTIVNTSLYIRRSAWLSPATQPDRIKSYPTRSNLFACRIFTPRERQNDQQKLPLVIRAHGGGMVVNNPSMDDPIARHLADNAHCIVVSIDYSKAPQNKFPIAYEDVIEQSLAVINDPELPLDRSRVVLCGSSGGGNLLLGAAQDARLRSKIMGVAVIYPPVDLTTDGPAKMATRPDPSIPDFIGDSYAGIGQLYLDPAQYETLADTRLSPTFFASRESLPPQILLIGAEHDMFCQEAEAMADKLVVVSGGSKNSDEAGWRAPGVQWYKVQNQPHAFDAFPVKIPEKEKARVAAIDGMYAIISQWLTDIFRTAGDTN